MPRWLKILVDAFLPPRCLLCGKILSEENGLCEECFTKINFISQPYCLRCGLPLASGKNTKTCPVCVGDNKNPFRMQRSMVSYDEASRPLLVNFKFHDRTEYAPFLARWLYTAGKDIWQEGADVLVPVPLHRARLRQRKYNQAALLCKELNKLTDIPVDYTSLGRHKNTIPQVECSGIKRKNNVKKAFSLKQENVFKNKRVVLIDDVLTTGATLRECAYVILASGAKSVDAISVARVIKN